MQFNLSEQLKIERARIFEEPEPPLHGYRMPINLIDEFHEQIKCEGPFDDYGGPCGPLNPYSMEAFQVLLIQTEYNESVEDEITKLRLNAAPPTSMTLDEWFAKRRKDRNERAEYEFCHSMAEME